MTAPSVVWFRQDLRLDDHPALRAAMDKGGPIIPLFIWSPDEEDKWQPASASRWWLHHSLTALHESLQQLNSKLILRQGKSLSCLWEVARATNADAVYWNRRYEATVIDRDTTIKESLREDGLTVESFNGSLLVEPWEIQTKQDEPYQVYSPFAKACLKTEMSDPFPKPQALESPGKWCESDTLDSLGLLPTIDWAHGIRDTWSPGESEARKLWKSFLTDSIEDYQTQRDRPDAEGTSRLSPHIHFGEIGPRRMWKELHDTFAPQHGGVMKKGPDTYRRELLWREFAYHLLYHFPKTTDEPLRAQFQQFPWSRSKRDLQAWQKGQTGYPLVDAGMRQLWTTGWMHNRVRMVVASFLVKHLLIPWQKGAEWFWDTLVDADLANNSLNWQWSAGCGADAAPYFRIFNPILQSEKFDPQGDYIAQWVPELADLPLPWRHKPWEAPEDVLTDSGIKLGKDYPNPIVDHKEARQKALDRYEQIKNQ